LNVANLKSRLGSALDQATAALLAARGPHAHWTGELSSSALSTATAVTALAIVDRESSQSEFRRSIHSGIEWLATHAHADGGWGDTVKSLSNVSTTILGWAAFGAVQGGDEKFRTVVNRAERWLQDRAGSLNPDLLARTVIARYGKDRTFSVPILTMCALAGRLGPKRTAWSDIIPLPFELAACPHQCFAALRLPVVSYALPALIAMGQAHHYHAPSPNPIARWVRNATRSKTLDVLTAIQPANGGFLEATPLTSFVTMSLAGSGQVNHLVTRRGVKFLIESQRADGSWPIDTNLATWLTTLAVNAIAASEGQPLKEAGVFSADRNESAAGIRRWLLEQQHRTEHPYTHAAPGGWAWTDLPGGVPDGDDTAGALLALRHLGEIDDHARDTALVGIRWLLDLQNRDGGMPTFCRGWGALAFDRSSADITAHAIRAWATWFPESQPPVQRQLRAALTRAQKFLLRTQRANGSWVPLWFGNQFEPNEENATYGTARIVMALADPAVALIRTSPMSGALERALQWLVSAQNADGSWGGFPEGLPSVEETSLAVEALAAVISAGQIPMGASREPAMRAMSSGVRWLIERIEAGTWTDPAPIGFYFAKLWYYEKMYPLIFTVGALGRAATALELNRGGGHRASTSLPLHPLT
jgi:squalene-hopene/tetraprenyl-beta-curcumene cyclase